MSAIPVGPAQVLRGAREATTEATLRPLRAAGIEKLKDLLRVCRARHRYRRDLRRLLRVGPHMMDDIGLDLHQARSLAL